MFEIVSITSVPTLRISLTGGASRSGLADCQLLAFHTAGARQRGKSSRCRGSQRALRAPCDRLRSFGATCRPGQGSPAFDRRPPSWPGRLVRSTYSPTS
jgi:hypothetical protein